MMNDYNPNSQNNDIAESETFVIRDVGINSKKKITTRYKIWITIAVLIMVVILYFCSIIFIKAYNKSKSRDEFYVQQEVLEYLKERYNEEFVVVYNRGMGPAYNYVQLYAYPKEYKDEKHKFEIQGYYNKWGKLKYYDSYVMVRLADDYEACVDEIIDEYFDDYKFYLEFNSEWITSNLPSDTELEDLFELQANVDYPLPYLDIFFMSSQKENFTDDNVMDMCEKLATWGYRGSIHTVYYDDDQYYKKKNNENKRECLPGEEFHWEYHVIFIKSDKDIDYR